MEFYGLMELYGIYLPSGKQPHNYGQSPFEWENSLVLWPFSKAFCIVYQRVYHGIHPVFGGEKHNNETRESDA